MATFLELQTLVLELMSSRVTTPSSYSGSPSLVQIKATINNVRRRVNVKLWRAYPDRFSTEGTLTYTARAEKVALSSALSAANRRPISLVQALPSDSSDALERVRLQPKTREELESWNARAFPEVFFYDFNAGNIHIRPVPDSATTLYVYYIPALTALSADGDTPSELMDFGEMLSYGATAWLMKKLGDPQWNIMQEEYDGQCEDLKKLIGFNHRDTHIQHVPRY